jgi:hypothetical protein
MRIARVIQESSPFPVSALERDGALYEIGELAQCLGSRGAPDLLMGATDFFARVIALRCAGLATLDERLCAGDRPTEARIQPGSFVWLPPCDIDRALYVHVEPPPLPNKAGEPSYRIGNARGLLGHEARVAFPAHETRPDFELGFAAVIGEDLRHATVEEAEQAIIGYAILNDWTARDEEARHGNPGRARDFATQLGPLLVTRTEVGEVAVLRMQARVSGEVVGSGVIGMAGEHLAEGIAFVSHRLELRAGDLVGVTCMRGQGVPYGATVELLIERLGKLTGCAAQGPPATRWKR